MVLVGGPAMVEASQTLLPTGEILAIVIVGVLSTAFLVSAPLLIGEGLQRRANARAQATPRTGAEPALTAAPGDDVPGRRQPTAADAARQGVAPADAAAMAVRHDIPAQRGEPAPQAEEPHAGQSEQDTADAAAEAPTEPIPAAEGPGPVMPAQRSGDYDRPEPSLAGSVPPEEEETRRE